MVHQKPCHRRFRMQQEHRRLLVRLQGWAPHGLVKCGRRERARHTSLLHCCRGEVVEARAAERGRAGPIAAVAVVQQGRSGVDEVAGAMLLHVLIFRVHLFFATEVGVVIIGIAIRRDLLTWDDLLLRLGLRLLLFLRIVGVISVSRDHHFGRCLRCLGNVRLGLRGHILFGLRVLLLRRLQTFHQLLEERSDVHVRGMDENRPVHLALLSRLEVAVLLHIQADIGVAHRMHCPSVVPAAGHHEPQLALLFPPGAKHGVRRHESPGATIMHQDPPLLELGAGQERGVHGTGGLALVEVRARHRHRHGGQIALGDGILVVDLDIALDLYSWNVLAEGLHVQLLLVAEAQSLAQLVYGAVPIGHDLLHRWPRAVPCWRQLRHMREL
mmetsp:Transcript_76622/g.206552  ORF Transcript_76622/g.206552 Transcript_76622/m.206552 type:complete len:384 (-) Transcript_76622:1317-2468(-)